MHLSGPPLAVRVLWTAVAILAVTLLAFFVFWLATLIVLGWIVLKVLQLSPSQPRFTWEPTDPEDRKRHLFYDPLTHNHDPDPRFEDQ